MKKIVFSNMKAVTMLIILISRINLYPIISINILRRMSNKYFVAGIEIMKVISKTMYILSKYFRLISLLLNPTDFKIAILILLSLK